MMRIYCDDAINDIISFEGCLNIVCQWIAVRIPVEVWVRWSGGGLWWVSAYNCWPESERQHFGFWMGGGVDAQLCRCKAIALIECLFDHARFDFPPVCSVFYIIWLVKQAPRNVWSILIFYIRKVLI